MIMTLQESADRVGNGFGFYVAVNLVKNIPLAVIVDQRPGLAFVSRLPLPDRLFVIIRPVDQRATVQVADSLLLWRLEVNVVDFPAHRARATPRRPLDEQLPVDADVEQQRTPAPVGFEKAVKKPGLPESTRETVQNEPAPTIRLFYSRFDDAADDLVRIARMFGW